MYLVGLTGGIGCGKSEAARCFVALGVPMVDTDVIAHQLTAPGMPAVAQIANALGDGCLNANKALDRAKLRQKVFADPAARKLLEGILHPLIRNAVVDEIAKSPDAPYQIIVVPLLFETGGYPMVNATLVVDCDEDEQIRRATARGQLSADDVRAIMAAQLPRMDRLSKADDVIVNDGSLGKLAESVREKHEKYINTCLVRQSIT